LAKVHLSQVDQLLATSNGDLIGIGLVLQRQDARLDRVQGVAAPGHPGSDILDTHCAEDLEEAVGGTKAES